ncbi:MAG: PAS domain S-box protein [Acidobacteriota bacterium]
MRNAGERTRPRYRSTPQVLIFAGLSILAVVLLRSVLQPVLGVGAPLLPFILAVMLNAWYGGLGSGMATTFVSAGVGAYLFIEPNPGLWITDVSDMVQLVLYCSIGSLVSVLTGRLHSARRLAEVRSEESELKTLELQNEIAGRMQAQEKLRQVSRAVEHSPTAIVISDRQGRIQYVNPRFTDITGYSQDEAVGLNLDVLRPDPGEDDSFQQLRDAAASGTEWRGEVRNRKKDGSLYWAAISVSPVTNESGEFTHVVAIGEDISQRRSLEAQLRQAQKLEALGRLAGGVAHDFNNLLTSILGFSGLLQAGLQPDDPRRADLEEIQRAGERAASLTSQLLAFSRHQALAPVVLNLNDTVAAMERMLRRLLGEDIELASIPSPELGNIQADRGLMEQVIMNIAVNARDAMPGGGRLVLETANVELDDRYAQTHVGVQPGLHVMLAVSDTGCGMTPEVMSQIFEPFFTTKREGIGTGLGLSIVYGIVKQSGGHIQVYSELGQGTVFKIFFPAVSEKAEPPPPRASTETLRGTERVLAVEDDESVRNIICRTLESYGYTVLEAASADEAIRVCGQSPQPVHLLLTDVVMPGMSGVELSRQLGSENPAMKVLFISGFTANTITHFNDLGAGVQVLHKPFTSERLAQRVREVLDAG